MISSDMLNSNDGLDEGSVEREEDDDEMKDENYPDRVRPLILFANCTIDWVDMGLLP